jgi:hypothetical protein
VPCCPPGTSQMAVVGSPRSIRLLLGIDVQHDPGYLAPVGALLIGIKHAHIGDGVLLVVCSERWTVRCQIGNIGIKRRHGRFSQTVSPSDDVRALCRPNDI